VIYSQQGRKIFRYDFKSGMVPDQLSAFTTGKKMYVLCASRENDLTWVFEMTNGHYPKSPVKGGFPGFISNINNEGITRLVTASAAGFVYFYLLN
jgi:hypothetical protein